MSTKSFLNNVHIRDKKSASKLLGALENASDSCSQDVVLSKSLEEVKGTDIKKLFGKQ